MNLFGPSRLRWAQNSTRCELIQKTNYPNSNATELEFKLARPETLTAYLRIPGWADARMQVSINGKRVEENVVPGKFLALKRQWKNGERVEFEIGMSLRFEAVDAQNFNLVALVREPAALFAVGDVPAKLSRAQMLASMAVAGGSEDWKIGWLRADRRKLLRGRLLRLGR